MAFKNHQCFSCASWRDPEQCGQLDQFAAPAGNEAPKERGKKKAKNLSEMYLASNNMKGKCQTQLTVIE